MIGSSSKERGKKEATENGDGYAPYVSQTARDKQNEGEERKTEHGVPYALASAAYGRIGDGSGSGSGGITEREASTRQYTRSRRDARISCVSRTDSGKVKEREKPAKSRSTRHCAFGPRDRFTATIFDSRLSNHEWNHEIERSSLVESTSLIV